MANTTSPQPLSFDISQLPKDFGSSRFQNLLVTFDNLNQVFKFRTHQSFPVKCESFFSVTLVKGQIRLLINLHEVEVHAGQILALTPGCIFQGISVSEDLKFFGVMMAADFLDGMRKNLGFQVDLTRRYHNFTVHETSPLIMQNSMQMYEILCQELKADDYRYKRDVVQRYCEILVLKNISFSSYTGNLPSLNRPLNRKEQIFHDFLAYLEQYYTQERSISFYADRICLTPKYLSTIIKEVSGKHGMQWIDEYVSLEAKALLRNSNLSVKQVSDQLNFPSQSMFGRFFKKMTGYSPKQYKML